MSREDQRWFLEVALLTMLAIVVGALSSLLVLWCIVEHPVTAALIVFTAIVMSTLRLLRPIYLPMD